MEFRHSTWNPLELMGDGKDLRQDRRFREEELDGGDFCEIGLAVAVQVVHGIYDVEALVVREEDCVAQVAWVGHARESGVSATPFIFLSSRRPGQKHLPMPLSIPIMRTLVF
ncbi:uncharacterized protein LACBIDRAFT_302979 [Laccaria bicolor S238N-H82]|uniref:Predicted protein n=1 Tax=Laccaria bicolor (strain S238N-H82 / ATCC MYA-4686) TaxID=486041 RepID=B0DIQ9_LACBS|nr:uncharacterized protein LACBIDRAFT_302979 [Laccaria bicolor S238N-H82]EDR05729.1 predicted protein [Laccaria bicolor S238N-H82]|eukprot:XP_001883833.1 predicted protein [Laccaria bicolor S238N-H82]